jgi:hypothetical protein
LGVSVGVSDQALQRIGLVMVVAAGLDYRRMKILERAVDVPVRTSAGWTRKTLTREIKDAFSQPPLDRLLSRVQDWLSEVDELFQVRDRYAHSITYYEVRGDGTAGSHTHHPKLQLTTPVVDEPELDDEILRLSDASSIGSRLEIETILLREDGVAAHDAHLKAHQDLEEAWRKMLGDADGSQQ